MLCQSIAQEAFQVNRKGTHSDFLYFDRLN
jgi:hypothetical protein